MKREWRYWMWNAEELVGMLVLATLIFSVCFGVIEGSLNHLWISGLLLMLLAAVWLMANAVQSGKLLSVSLMFGTTRKKCFAGMQIMALAVILQVEVLQMLLLLLPGINGDLQWTIIGYMPFLLLGVLGIGYFIAMIEKKSQKVYKVVFTISMAIVGGVIGFSMAMLAGERSDIVEIGKKVSEWMDGTVLLITAGVCMILYLAGAWNYRKNLLDMDVNI